MSQACWSFTSCSFGLFVCLKTIAVITLTSIPPSSPKHLVFIRSLLWLNLSLFYSFGTETLWEFFPLAPFFSVPEPFCSASNGQGKRCLEARINCEEEEGYKWSAAWQAYRRHEDACSWIKRNQNMVPSFMWKNWGPQEEGRGGHCLVWLLYIQVQHTYIEV